MSLQHDHRDGGKNGLHPAGRNHVPAFGASGCEVFETDGSYTFHDAREYDVSRLRPQVAAPFSVDNVQDVDEHVGTKIDQAFLGACTGGRIEDIAVAAYILRGKKIAPSVRLLVVPASKKILGEAMRLGYGEALVEAGATFVTPGCAACLGTHEGLIADGEVCISTSSRNFPGRMGHTEGRIYLASPATVAASALAGHIADPSPVFEKEA